MTSLHVGKNVLDHQLLDKDGRRCGKVDDLAIEDDRVVAIYAGRRASSRVRIPWEEVATVDSAVRLKRVATDYGLGRGDDRLRPFFERIPGANR
jgi:sporulation protein YlmC with PRC-barrel domain